MGYPKRNHQSEDQEIAKLLQTTLPRRETELGNRNSGERGSQRHMGIPEMVFRYQVVPVPAINRGPDKPPAVQHAEKCDALRDELFQPPPPLPHIPEPDLTNANPQEFEFVDVTKEEVRAAIFEQGPNKAPGISQSPFKAIRWAWDEEADCITNLIRQCLRTGYHPKMWRKAIAIALAKPKKPDYSNPRAYRLIQLLDCLGKVLEKVVATRLSHYVAKYNIVPANQFGARPGSATEDAILTFVNDV